MDSVKRGSERQLNLRQTILRVALEDQARVANKQLAGLARAVSLFTVSAVELAVRKVKKLSDRQARELLGWLDKQQANGTAPKRRTPASRRKAKARSMQKLLAWYDSIRLTTDWEPPRMPNDLVRPFRL